MHCHISFSFFIYVIQFSEHVSVFLHLSDFFVFVQCVFYFLSVLFVFTVCFCFVYVCYVVNKRQLNHLVLYNTCGC